VDGVTTRRLEVSEYLSNPTDLSGGRARTVQVERDDEAGRVRVDKAAGLLMVVKEET